MTTSVVTLHYRAPEILLGHSKYDTSIDMWSVGCVIAEMAQGITLFNGKSDIDQIFTIFSKLGTPNYQTNDPIINESIKWLDVTSYPNW
eukprot:CAMPEP_0196765170 /NCGR_PEP_ID=MMETSP1095-20130614/7715_1 /TAXON_ID=96789 ORGANISM="Chromulina nebulosa, Strain UTEXLB2642" /NCGR_SAMPLE_ID=MMETSP1095 /ASSEMBLY_ACC=CAM_ASM_000446 /LENGTH=88 /DNA_ID=CAMNT_0042122703 /DNA_START=527 /DNA_END=790 /DNA_ORIENTATION=-